MGYTIPLILSVLKTDDKYGLSKEYLLDLQFLLERNPMRKDDVFQFKGGIIPSLFQQYGIPFNESLLIFSFTKGGNNLILSDSFSFDNYTLTRKYMYNSNNVLEEVQIIVRDKKNKSTSQFREYFEIR